MNPLVRQFFHLTAGRTLSSIAQSAGFDRNTVARWRKYKDPKLSNFEAALNVLGYRLKIERIEK